MISSHFDSGISSHGATDSGIGVGAMLSIFQALARKSCQNQLENSVIFNINNAEEDGLLGASAFVRHDWFKSIKAFINIDGSGAKPHARSFLFRANSIELVENVLNALPYPHSSVIAAFAIRSSGSNTDFQPYATVGNLPGVDFAFYADRHLYHTMRDDIKHATSDSLQRIFCINIDLADNVFAASYRILSDSEFLKTVARDNTGESKTVEPPNYAFYDRFGLFSIVQSQKNYLRDHAFLLITVLILSIAKLFMRYYNVGYRKTVNQVLKPSLSAFLQILFAFSLTMILSILISIIRAQINPFASYGYRIWSLASTICLNIASLAAAEVIWPYISVRLGLSQKYAVIENQYQSLPVTDMLDDELSNDDDHLAIDAYSSGSQNEEMYSDIENGEDFTIGRTKKYKILSSWVPIGLTGFWSCAAIVSLIFSINGISILYLLYDFCMFSSLATFSWLALDSVYKHLLKKPVEYEYSANEERYLYLYQHYNLYYQLLISTAVPYFFMTDMIIMIVLGFSGLIGQIHPVLYDMLTTVVSVLPLLNFIPMISSTRSKWRSFLFFCLFLLIWTPMLFVNPFSSATPLTYGIVEQIEHPFINSSISIFPHQAVSPHTIIHNPVPENSTITDHDIKFDIPYSPIEFNHDLSLTWQKLLTQDGTILTGTFTGSSESRSCTLEFSEAGRLILNEGENYIDFETGQMDAEISYEANEKVRIYYRNFTDSRRIMVSFKLKYSKRNITIICQCAYRQEFSSFMRNYTASSPDWMTARLINDGGPLKIKKMFSI
jgi:hypothetical protein